MLDLIKTILSNQFEASLCMMHECLQLCPPQHWDGPIGKYPFWQVAYHTLCFTDLYLSPSETTFELRPIHPAGWAEFNDEYPSRRFDPPELLAYLLICRQKALSTFGAETRESLAGPTGHARRTFTRAELHLYSLRHIQHHTGQLSSFLRRIGKDPHWTGSGWNPAPLPA